jgi:CubicO group peptidase (beta-lactamase class C family)
MVISSEPATTAPARWAVCARASILSAIALASLSLITARAAEPAMDARIQAMLPELERVVADGMTAFDMPGLAIGIVRGDRLVYAKGFGTRGKADPAPVDTRTVFQIGSVAKSFLATTMAIAVDRGTLRWDDRGATSTVASEKPPFSRV